MGSRNPAPPTPKRKQCNEEIGPFRRSRSCWRRHPASAPHAFFNRVQCRCLASAVHISSARKPSTIDGREAAGGCARDGMQISQLDRRKDRCSPSHMGRLLDKLIRGSTAHDVKAENDGFSLVGKPDRLNEFSDLVREAVDHSGEDFVVFPTSDGHHGYSRMFVVPLDGRADP